MTADRVHLRSSLRQLRAVQFDRTDPANVATAPQEMLDFLAMQAGLKPVYLLGRGFNDPQWVSGVEAIARKKGMHVSRGPFWRAVPPMLDGIPPSIADLMRRDDNPSRTALYITRSPAIAKELDAINTSGRISAADEARLLGYPACCVRDHYQRSEIMDTAYFKLLQRIANGDEGEMKRLILEDVQMTPNEEEHRLFEAATRIEMAPFLSVHMCERCAADQDGPAARLSAKYAALAKDVDRELFNEVAGSRQL